MCREAENENSEDLSKGLVGSTFHLKYKLPLIQQSVCWIYAICVSSN